MDLRIDWIDTIEWIKNENCLFMSQDELFVLVYYLIFNTLYVFVDK